MTSTRVAHCKHSLRQHQAGDINKGGACHTLAAVQAFPATAEVSVTSRVMMRVTHLFNHCVVSCIPLHVRKCEHPALGGPPPHLLRSQRGTASN